MHPSYDLKKENIEAVHNFKYKNINRSQAMLSLTQNKWGNYAWNKVFKRDIISNIDFPIGKIYEDIFTTYKTYSKCKSICLIDNILYYYRQRRDSLSNQWNDIASKNKSYEDLFIGTYEQLIFLKIIILNRRI